MALQLDQDGKTILYRGKPVGQLVGKNVFTLEIECDDGDQRLEILTAIATALVRFQPEQIELRIETSPEDYGPGTLDEPKVLVEAVVKAKGEIWKFNKNDNDPWPSKLHGHNVERPTLKIDAITGDVYSTTTRKKVDTAGDRALSVIHDRLKESKDFKNRPEVLALVNAEAKAKAQ